MQDKVSEKSIKSVRRVFEVLELFAAEQRPLPAKEVARRLDYPLSSTHALLKSMHELGYAEFTADDWSYAPSAALPALLSWVQESLDTEQHLLDFVQALNAETRETINISRQQGLSVKIIRGYESTHTLGISVKEGTLMPITRSLTGIAAIAGLKDLSDLLADLERQDPAEFALLDQSLLDDVFAEVQQFGSVIRCDVFMQGIGAVCVPVLSSTGDVFVVGVVGPSDRIKAGANAHFKSIRRLASEHGIRTQFKLRPR